MLREIVWVAAGLMLLTVSSSEAMVARRNVQRSSVAEALARVASEHGISMDVLRRFSDIESGNNPRRRTGSYKGLFQLSNSDFRKHGGAKGKIFDPYENAKAFAGKVKENTRIFSQRMGREPTGAELYMMHQQGSAGAEAHLNNPDQPAWKSMASTREGRNKGERWAKKAIWGNLPPKAKKYFGDVDQVTSKAFVNLWERRYEKEPDMLTKGVQQVGLAAKEAGRAFTGYARDLNNFVKKGVVNLEGLGSEFRDRVGAMLEAMPENLRQNVGITSGYRDPEHQAAILRRRLGKRATPAALSRGIPGKVAGVVLDKSGKVVGSKSRHGRGIAVDIHGNKAAMAWLHKNAPAYGVVNPKSLRKSDPVHFQLMDGKIPAVQMASAEPPSNLPEQRIQNPSRRPAKLQTDRLDTPVVERQSIGAFNVPAAPPRFSEIASAPEAEVVDPAVQDRQDYTYLKRHGMPPNKPLPEPEPDDEPRPGRPDMPLINRDERRGARAAKRTGVSPTPDNANPNWQGQAFGGTFGELFARPDMGNTLLKPPKSPPLFKQLFGGGGFSGW